MTGRLGRHTVCIPRIQPSTDNTFQNAGAGQYTFATFLSGNDWTAFASTLSSNNNHWYDPNTATSFKIPNGKLVNLAGWQSNTSEDLASNWGQSTIAASPARCQPLRSPTSA